MLKQQSNNQHPFINANDISFAVGAGSPIVSHLSFSLHNEKVGLVGKNGVGKTTLLRLILNDLQPTSGTIERYGSFAYLPQDLHPSLEKTIAEALGIHEKLQAIALVKQSDKSHANLSIINNDWGVQDRALDILGDLGFLGVHLDRKMQTLSGGERMKVVLARLLLQNPDCLIMDEPTNNLDYQSRLVVYDLVRKWSKAMIVVSHDRELLNHMERIWELSEHGLQEYGGNYAFYEEQRTLERDVAQQQLEHAQKELKKTKQQARAVKERQAKRNAHGEKYGKDRGIPKIILGAMKRRGEETSAKLKGTHETKIIEATSKLEQAKQKVRPENEIRVDLSKTEVPNGKQVVELKGISFHYPVTQQNVLDQIDLAIYGPQRIAISGSNGSGKTTLVKLILGELAPTEGEVFLGVDGVVYLDQHVLILDRDKTLLENVQRKMPGKDDILVRQYLGRFLFFDKDAFKKVSDLSGGEKMRAALATILAGDHPPQLLILDEPTNNLDLNSIEQVESALSNFRGALVIISHDQKFMERIGITREICLDKL